MIELSPSRIPDICTGAGTPSFVSGIGPTSNNGTGHPAEVKAYDFDGTTVLPTPTDITAYAVDKHGVNVGTANLDPPCTYCTPERTASILTAPGPGDVYGPQIKGWWHFFGGLPRTEINFYAYSTLKFGALVDGANLKSDGGPDVDEIVTVPGPTPLQGARVRGWEYTSGIPSNPSFDTAPLFTGEKFGAHVAGTYIKDCGGGQDCNAILVAESEDPAATTRTLGNEVNAAFTAIPGFDFDSFSGVTLGSSVAGVKKTEPFTLAGSKVVPTDWIVWNVRMFLRDTDDGTFECLSCPKPIVYNEWGSLDQKKLVLSELGDLYAKLPDLEPYEVVSRIDDVATHASDPALGLLNEQAKGELLSQLAYLRGFYDPAAFPSSAVTATLSPMKEPSAMTLSEPTGKMFIRPRPGTPGSVHVADARTVEIQGDRSLTIDGSHAFVSNPEADLLDYVFLGPPSLAVQATCLERTVLAVPAAAFINPGAKQSMYQGVETVQTLLGNAEKAPNEKAEQALLKDAEKKLAQLMKSFDGCTGGDASDDTLTDCDEKRSLTLLALDLQAAIDGRLLPRKPMTGKGPTP